MNKAENIGHDDEYDNCFYLAGGFLLPLAAVIFAPTHGGEFFYVFGYAFGFGCALAARRMNNGLLEWLLLLLYILPTVYMSVMYLNFIYFNG